MMQSDQTAHDLLRGLYYPLIRSDRGISFRIMMHTIFIRQNSHSWRPGLTGAKNRKDRLGAKSN